MSDFDPVEIRIDYVQNVDTEGKKASDAMDDVAASSNKMSKEVEKSVAAQKVVIDNLLKEIKALQAQMGKKVDTGDEKQIAEKQDLIAKVDLLNKKLKEQEAILESLRKKNNTPNPGTLPGLPKDPAAYAKSVNQLGYSVQQVARELPSLAISPQTFILAISNNLPILQDQLRKTRLQNEALKASGQSTVPVWKQVAGSIFSWQTAMVALITVGAVYGKEIAAWIGKTLQLGDAAKLTGAEVKKMTGELSKNFGTELGKLDSLFDRLKSAEQGTAAYNRARKDIIDSYGKYLNGMDSEITKLNNIEGAYHAIREAIIEVAKQKSLDQLYTEQFTEMRKVVDAQLPKIRKLFVGRWGEGIGQSYYEQLQRELESGKGLSYQMKRIVDDFKKTESRITPGTNGQSFYEVEVNAMREAIDIVAEAQKNANSKIEQGKALFKSLYGSSVEAASSLIAEQELLLEQAKLMPEKTEAEIAAKNKKIEAINSEIKRLKELGKTQDKDANDRVTAAEELAQKEQEVEIMKTKAIIALMEDGLAKKKALAKQDYDERLAQLNKLEKDYLDKLNKRKNLKPTDSGYITSLSDYTQKNPNDTRATAYLKNLNDLRLTADREFVNTAEKLENDAADTRKKIWASATQAFLSNVDKEKQAINEKYDELIKNATEAGATQAEIDNLIKQRAQALAQVQGDSALKLSTFYSNAFGDIDRYGTSALKNLKQQIDEVLASAKQIDQGGKTLIQVEMPTDQFDKDGNRIKETVNLTIEEFARLQNKADDVSNTLKSRNPFRALAESWKDFKKAIDSGNKDAVSNATKDLIDNAKVAVGQIEDLSSGLREAFGNDVGDVVDLMNGIADGALSIAEGISSGNPVAVIKGVLQVYNSLTTGAKEYRAAQREWLNELIALQVKYNAVLNEQIRLQAEANIFITDYAAIAVNAAKALTDAQQNFNGQLVRTKKILSEGDHGDIIGKEIINESLEEYLARMPIKIGVKKKKFLGITVGKEDVYGSLLKEYPELIDSAGKFNAQLAETLLGMDGMLPKVKLALEALIEYQKEIDAANEAMAEAVKNLAGSLGGELADSLHNAWKEGEDGFEAFKNTVSSGIEDIISQLIFNSVFADSFTKLQEDLTSALAAGATPDDILKAYQGFYAGAKDRVAEYNALMDANDQAAKEAGFDFDGTDTPRTGSAKGIAQASQDSVDELNGRMTAIQAFIYDIRNINQQIYDLDAEAASMNEILITHLERISQNTEYCRKLEDVDQKLNTIIISGIKIKN